MKKICIVTKEQLEAIARAGSTEMTTHTRRRLVARLYPKFAGSPFSLIRGIAKLERKKT